MLGCIWTNLLECMLFPHGLFNRHVYHVSLGIFHHHTYPRKLISDACWEVSLGEQLLLWGWDVTSSQAVTKSGNALILSHGNSTLFHR